MPGESCYTLARFREVCLLLQESGMPEVYIDADGDVVIKDDLGNTYWIWPSMRAEGGIYVCNPNSTKVGGIRIACPNKEARPEVIGMYT